MGVFRTLAAGVALAASLAAVSPASALVVKYYYTGGASDGMGHVDQFDPSDPIGTLPAKFLYETAAKCGVVNGCTYDFIFKLDGLAPGDTTTLEVGAQAFMVTAEPISFDLFKGAPGSVASPANNMNPNFLGHSDNTNPTSPVFAANLGDGFYYVQIQPFQVKVSGEASSGSLVESLVPEPTAWSLMLLGVGAAGAALRRRRSAASTAA
jgi:hypothetical protein